MERHIGVWHREEKADKSEVGELIINGNQLEFYCRLGSLVYPETFIGYDGEHGYKVFTMGLTQTGQNRVVDYVYSHRVFYVLMQNFGFSKGTDITDIKEVSFTFPELSRWVGIDTVFYCSTDQDEPAAGEFHIEPISVKEGNPSIEIYFESKTYESNLTIEDATTITIKKEPRIRVVYEKSANITTVHSNIECIMQFFGLLIGKTSDVSDIRLTIEGQGGNSWLYINYDFSYNLMTQGIINKPRSYHYVISENLNDYFDNWYTFFYDDQYRLLRQVYFSVNNRKAIFAEEVFVEYIRFLDGYHARKYGDAETEEKLKEALKEVTKVIKKQLFNEKNKPIFEKAFQSVIPDWKFNASHVGSVSEWIAAGYSSRKSLSHRLKELDKDHFGIIEHNALAIEKEYQVKSLNAELSDEQLIENFYKELSDTRNYYSHYKQDKTGVLNILQMKESINVLKALIVSIFLSHIGLNEGTIRRMLVFDDELDFQTLFLRKQDDKPFLTPKEWMHEQYTETEG